ncbi:MAG TPA: hypothetical protein VFZ84_03600 [Burkholderiales bacterium]
MKRIVVSGRTRMTPSEAFVDQAPARKIQGILDDLNETSRRRR